MISRIVPVFTLRAIEGNKLSHAVIARRAAPWQSMVMHHDCHWRQRRPRSMDRHAPSGLAMTHFHNAWFHAIGLFPPWSALVAGIDSCSGCPARWFASVFKRWVDRHEAHARYQLRATRGKFYGWAGRVATSSLNAWATNWATSLRGDALACVDGWRARTCCTTGTVWLATEVAGMPRARLARPVIRRNQGLTFVGN